MHEKLATVESLFKRLDQVVWVVTAARETAAHETTRGGLTATWIHQASIDVGNPVVHAGIAPNHFTRELIDAAGCFGLHLLRPEQADVAFHFGHASGRDFDKFANIDVADNPYGIPLLTDCYASFCCRVFNRSTTGDRIYYLADVVDVAQHAEGPVMRESDFFSQCNEDEILQLKSGLSADVELQRPLQREWRKNLDRKE